MGSCSSVHRKTNTVENNTKQKISSFRSKSEELVIPTPPIKEKPKNGTFKWSPSKSSNNFTDYGSKEEIFFDSKAWIDSDCEDDFYSVNGDFTPSRGNTPVHHNFKTPVLKKPSSPNMILSSPPESSPEKKMKLLELFEDSVKNNQDNEDKENSETKPTIQNVLPKSSHSTPNRSGANSTSNSERIASEGHISGKGKSIKSSLFCIPSVSSWRKFREKTEKTSPAIAVN